MRYNEIVVIIMFFYVSGVTVYIIDTTQPARCYNACDCFVLSSCFQFTPKVRLNYLNFHLNQSVLNRGNRHLTLEINITLVKSAQ